MISLTNDQQQRRRRENKEKMAEALGGGREQRRKTSTNTSWTLVVLIFSCLLLLVLSPATSIHAVAGEEESGGSVEASSTNNYDCKQEDHADSGAGVIDGEAGCENKTNFNNSENVCPTQGLIDWMRAGGGFFSDKIEIRRQNPNDPTSPYGVFAAQDIEKNETVLKIPSSLYLKLSEEEIAVYDFDYDEGWDEEASMEAYYTNTCRLAKHLREETELYRTSVPTKYAAFVRYLEETQTKGQLPAAYSKEGKAILRAIQGKWNDTKQGKKEEVGSYGDAALPPLELVDWIDIGFIQRGCIDADDQEGSHFVAMTIQRGYDTELIPIWDMVNHDNYKLNLESSSIHSDEGVTVWAGKHIKAGDELYASYNFCTECTDGSGEDWGTPGIFRDFGFIEDYPQYWPFLDHAVYVLIERKNESGDTFQARLYAEPVDNEESEDENAAGRLDILAPTKEGLEFFQEQLSRLQGLDVDSEVEKLTAPHEKYMIRQYYLSLLHAITAIVDSSKNGTNNQLVATTMDE